MGQYHYLVNLTKREFVNPHMIGNGLKLREQVGWPHSTSTVLVMLLAASNGRGGGDFGDHELVGTWAGDKVAFIGDYADVLDLKKAGYNAPRIYDVITSDNPKQYGWTDISMQVREMMVDEFDIHYKGTSGWVEIGDGPEPEPVKKKGWVEGNPLVVFDYPDSRNYDSPKRREVRLIEANDEYVIGLDTLDKNRFKKFKRSRIQFWRSREILSFKS